MTDRSFPELDEPLANLFFHGSVVDALKQLQLLETCLKGYLEDVYWVANKARPAGIPFLFPEKEIAKMPLGSLVRFFRRHSEDHALLKKLLQVESERVHIAHRSLLLNLDRATDDSTQARLEATRRAREIKALAQSCSMTILAEIRRVRAALPEDQRNPEWK